jgi:hypothetical protein
MDPYVARDVVQPLQETQVEIRKTPEAADLINK